MYERGPYVIEVNVSAVAKCVSSSSSYVLWIFWGLFWSVSGEAAETWGAEYWRTWKRADCMFFLAGAPLQCQ